MTRSISHAVVAFQAPNIKHSELEKSILMVEMEIFILVIFASDVFDGGDTTVPKSALAYRLHE